MALSTLSPRTFRSKGDLVVSLPRVALFFFVFHRPESGVGVRVAVAFVALKLSQGVPREARRNACAAKRRTPWPSDPSQAGRWERGRDKRW